jgi:hypothetical protein
MVKKRERFNEATECERVRKRRKELTTSNVEIKHAQNGEESDKQQQKRTLFLTFFTLNCCYICLFLTILERRTAHYDSCVTSTVNTDIAIPTNSTSNMAMSTTSHPSSNPSLFAYRNAVNGGSTIRQRALVETNTNSLLITTERYKSNMSSSMRPARQPLTTTTTTTTMPSAYMSSQQSQRNVNQNIRTRIQQDKLTNSKGRNVFPYFFSQSKNFDRIQIGT